MAPQYQLEIFIDFEIVVLVRCYNVLLSPIVALLCGYRGDVGLSSLLLHDPD